MSINATRVFPAGLLTLTATACTSACDDNLLSAVGIIVNAVIAGIGFYIGRSVRRSAAVQMELDRARADREKKAQEHRGRLQAFDGYRREIGRFADTVIDVMGEIQVLIAFNPARAGDPEKAGQRFVEERSRLIGRVSSLIDRGRFFFPNDKDARIGEHKGSAQQGLRDQVLNRVLAASYVVMATDYEIFGRNGTPWICWKTLTTGAEGSAGHVRSAFQLLSEAEQRRLADILKNKDGIRLRDLIVSAKRAFVSEVFEIVQPSEWFKKVDSVYRSSGVTGRGRSR